MILATNPLATDPLAGLASAGIEPPPDPPGPIEGGVVSFAVQSPAAVTKITMDWTADEDGECEGQSLDVFDGKLFNVAILPGTPTPTDGYDVFLFDEDRHDLLLGNGRNTDSSAPVTITSKNLAAVCGQKLTLTIVNAGDSAEGRVLVFIR